MEREGSTRKKQEEGTELRRKKRNKYRYCGVGIEKKREVKRERKGEKELNLRNCIK